MIFIIYENDIRSTVMKIKINSTTNSHKFREAFNERKGINKYSIILDSGLICLVFFVVSCLICALLNFNK